MSVGTGDSTQPREQISIVVATQKGNKDFAICFEGQSVLQTDDL